MCIFVQANFGSVVKFSPFKKRNPVYAMPISFILKRLIFSGLINTLFIIITHVDPNKDHINLHNDHADPTLALLFLRLIQIMIMIIHIMVLSVLIL